MKPKIETVTSGDGVASGNDFQTALLHSFFNAVDIAVRVEELDIPMAKRRMIFDVIAEVVGKTSSVATINDYKLRCCDIGRINLDGKDIGRETLPDRSLAFSAPY